MNSNDMLAGLLAQAASQGSDIVTLRAMVEEASEVGARRMLSRIGLDDATAPQDVGELRELLQAWRDAKSSARRTVVGWIMRGALALLLLGLTVRCGATELLR
ncbi:DUF6127 family protein [Novosphingobium guangzhouense]|uniref:Uncharacterized protein n=1 Tax=Novosphingobium guangzhouense TaxID=1850347 RepID=A0A2K2G0T8_9SPHN|nr:DUF6127 family protein [Novosphingobium guangzhouense]PNU04656.1 hypothetical protein A8V01_18820 [Novosphingobium guangzhouense]